MKRLYDSALTSARLFLKHRNPWPEGEEGLAVRDHRQMVGGMWDPIGELQFAFLKQAGLKPSHVFCDVGCGSFRAGRLLMAYLEPGNYLGIDKQEALIREGREKEVAEELWAEKQPEIVLSDRFEFERFSKRPEFAIANSLFSHLRAADIRLCLRELAKKSAPGCKFFATYFESEVPVIYLTGSHSSRRFQYTKSQMLAFGEETGWQSTYIGDWNHPRGQVMVLYEKPAA